MIYHPLQISVLKYCHDWPPLNLALASTMGRVKFQDPGSVLGHHAGRFNLESVGCLLFPLQLLVKARVNF